MPKPPFLVGLAIGAALGIAGYWINGKYQVKANYGTCLQTYPNISGKLVLENDKVSVQRFSFPPGQWEGVHAHPSGQLFVHLTDAHWKARYGERVETGRWPAGSVGWIGPVHLAEDHESVNIGDEPIDLILITLKEGCTGQFG